MSLQLEVIFLENSGFVVQTEHHVLIFDYYEDPSCSLTPFLEMGKTLYVFCSHRHHDHFNPIISTWQDHVAMFFLSDDIIGIAGVCAEKIASMCPYETRNEGGVQVRTYGSTDVGVSFLVEVDGWRLFHAGDLNWWHWKWDHAHNLMLAKDLFEREMQQLAGLQLDVAFFPVDSRLEEYRTAGVEEFCRRVDVKQLVAMHTRGRSWVPSSDFPGNGKRIASWCPVASGERLELSKIIL